MNCVIKLKDCNVIDIDSEFVEYTTVDYYWNGENSEEIEKIGHIQKVIFKFDDSIGDTLVKIPLENSNFTHIVSFFYNKDFSDTKRDDFIDDFCNHVGGWVES